MVLEGKDLHRLLLAKGKLIKAEMCVGAVVEFQLMLTTACQQMHAGFGTGVIYHPVD